MLEREIAQKQLEAIKTLDHTVFILLRYVHFLIDESIIFESDTNQFCWGLYGEVMTQIYTPVHQLFLMLKQEWEVMYNGNIVGSNDKEELEIVFNPEWEEEE